jgi:hypothetical protein
MARKNSGKVSARLRRERLDVAPELETVFEEAQVGDEGFWAGGLDFCDDGLQAIVRNGVADYFCEFFDSADGACFGDAGGASYALKIGASAGGGGESADREETLVIKNDVEEILGFVSREGGESAEIHEQRAVTIEHDDFLMWQGEREAEASGRCEAHGVLQIEKIGAMAEGLEFRGERAHDGDDETVFKIGINSTKAIEAEHYSSHIKSRVRRRATG